MVDEKEYQAHRLKCKESFEDFAQKFVDIFQKLDRQERAMFGEPGLKQKGLVDMTSEMYDSVMMVKGGRRILIGLISVAGAIITITAAFWAVYEFVKRVSVK